MEKEVIKLIKMEKKLQRPYLTDYSSLTVKYLWQAHYQILLMEFIKLNVNTDTIKSCSISKFITLAIV